MRRVAVRLALAGSPAPNAVAARIRAWLARYVRFVPDPVRDELIHDPVVMLETLARDGVAAGDCDDVATLGATLAESVGLPARFRVLGFDAPGAPFSHVYAEVLAGSRWMELDTTRQIPIIERDRRTSRTGVWEIASGESMLGCACQFSMEGARSLAGGLGEAPIIVQDGEPLPPGEWECIEVAEASINPWMVAALVLGVIALGNGGGSRRQAY